jgi:hypothetical protein
MSQIPSATSLDPALGQRTPNRFNEMTSEDFMKIIFTELENQDPLQPNDTSALLDQLGSIRSIESDVKLTEQLQALVRENRESACRGELDDRKARERSHGGVRQRVRNRDRRAARREHDLPRARYGRRRSDRQPHVDRRSEQRLASGDAGVSG